MELKRVSGTIISFLCMLSCSYFVILTIFIFMNAVERFSLGVRNPTAFLAGAMVSNQFFLLLFLQSGVFEDELIK